MKARRIAIYLLLFSGCSIKHIDRVVLSVSATPIAREFGLSTIQLGDPCSEALRTRCERRLAGTGFVGSERIARSHMRFSRAKR